MDDLTSLLGGSLGKGNDLIDRLTVLLDRQTDHKLNPNMLFGFLGMYNLLSIVSMVRESSDQGIKEVTGSVDTSNTKPAEQSLMDGLSSLLNNQSGGQPDLMGLLGSMASKKKINPNLLLSLFSMLNNQTAQNSSPVNKHSEQPGEATSGGDAPLEEQQPEKKTPEDKQGVELKYDRKKGIFDRS